jgi:AcrR family transcriptional regulator
VPVFELFKLPAGRVAIVDAAAALIARGECPSIADIASAADVSRRTVYLYFSTLEELLLDATLGLLTETSVDHALDDDDTEVDVETRVDRVLRALGQLTADSLPLGRALIRLTVDAPAAGGREAAHPPVAPRRGYRRVAWIERAIAPLRERLDPLAFERLVSVLALVIGWEAFIVLSDVRGLSTPEQIEITTWAARVLIRATLTEADQPSGRFLNAWARS